ncbi:uncharacterized protein H6S33_001975 [Morchella sextelata]|uniref:uncharacterized protein n=1 Tax=Morchella sextelata TaxID=1174677 RepID=UPI001D04F4F6|nr:uncharacterized protein H6S33_001975 [Morchella sextelata]KAH0607923.1 hypothetical protein H6S33_001975 [Morchella sextelata]
MGRLKGRQKEEREEHIRLAIERYQTSKDPSIRECAETFNIPYSTLRDRLQGKSSRRDSHRRQQLLSEHEEKSVVAWCIRMDDWGFPLKLSLVKEMAAYLIKKRNSGHKLGDYFQLLQEVIRKYNILPKNTYNMDEKGFMMGIAAKCKIICRRARKNPRLTHNGSREWVTVIEAVSGAGEALPPMVINQGMAHYKGWYAGVKGDDIATFSYSPKGWTDSFLGMEWLIQNFDKFTADKAEGEWRLLIMDGHASHVTWEFFDYCLNHKIVPSSANSAIPQGAAPTPWAPGTPGAARAECSYQASPGQGPHARRRHSRVLAPGVATAGRSRQVILASAPDAPRASTLSDITYIHRAPSNALSAIFSRRVVHFHASCTSRRYGTGNESRTCRGPPGDSVSALTALVSNICARRSNHNELLARRCQSISLTPREHSSVLSAPGEHSQRAARQAPPEHIAHAKTLFVNEFFQALPRDIAHVRRAPRMLP